MTIELRIYTITGSLFDVRTFDNASAAFDSMTTTAKPATAYMQSTPQLAYFYRPEQDGHTLDGFCKRLELDKS